MARHRPPAHHALAFLLTTATAGCYAQAGVGVTYQGKTTVNLGAGISFDLGSKADVRLTAHAARSKFERPEGEGTIGGGLAALGFDYRLRKLGSKNLVLNVDAHLPFGAITLREEDQSASFAMRTYIGASVEHPFMMLTSDGSEALPWGWLRVGAGPELFAAKSRSEIFGSQATIGPALIVSMTTARGATLDKLECWLQRNCE